MTTRSIKLLEWSGPALAALMIVFIAGPPIADAAPLVGHGDSAGILSSSGGGTNLVWYVVLAVVGALAVAAVTYLASQADRHAVSTGRSAQARAIRVVSQQDAAEDQQKAA